MKVFSNRHKRDIIYGYDLTDKERDIFDYYSNEDIVDRQFFRYKREVYDLSEFMTTSGLPDFSPLRMWHAYMSDSYFSGIVIKFCDDYENIIIGTFIS